MTQKIVTFEAAKALKEAGYWNPGTIIKCSYNNGCYVDDGRFYKDGCVCPWDHLYPAPTYIETWLWLWIEKGIKIHVGFDCCIYFNKEDYTPIILMVEDPEEAIAKAIDYLVDRNLIK